MIEARFASGMKEMLKAMEGAEFAGYSATEFYEKETVHDGKIYLHIDDKTIKISNEVKEIPWFNHKDLSNSEEIFSFSCAETSEQGEQKVLVKETIESIEIITDYIKIPQNNYEIVLDMALIIVTGEHRYMISRGWHFGDYLDINVDKNYDKIYPVSQVVAEWNNYGEWEVIVERCVEEL